ncbi:hypothetical protein ColTof3_08647 [Colletotrichum tofieldiae]|nr:hypothetical protein ColTof3_08647 [Colletotrichum tofieldiae]
MSAQRSATSYQFVLAQDGKTTSGLASYPYVDATRASPTSLDSCDDSPDQWGLRKSRLSSGSPNSAEEKSRHLTRWAVLVLSKCFLPCSDGPHPISLPTASIDLDAEPYGTSKSNIARPVPLIVPAASSVKTLYEYLGLLIPTGGRGDKRAVWNAYQAAVGKSNSHQQHPPRSPRKSRVQIPHARRQNINYGRLDKKHFAKPFKVDYQVWNRLNRWLDENCRDSNRRYCPDFHLAWEPLP